MQPFPPVESLLPHRPPAIVVDEIVAFEKGKIRCRRTVRENEHYGPGLSPEGIVEFCAQAAILHEALAAGGAMKKGVLAGIDDFIFPGAAAAGDVVEAEIIVKTKFGGLGLFECTATVNGAPLAHGFIKAAQS
jgi:3-hydroxymyristoyl/3-hydroxydecanoyl-(acyl carrier protein) dehydratase